MYLIAPSAFPFAASVGLFELSPAGITSAPVEVTVTVDPVDGANSIFVFAALAIILSLIVRSPLLSNEPSVFISPLAVIFPVCFSISI